MGYPLFSQTPIIRLKPKAWPGHIRVRLRGVLHKLRAGQLGAWVYP